MDPSIIAAAIVTVLAAVTLTVVTIIDRAAAARDRAASRIEREATRASTQATENKADTIIEKAAEIHMLADGNLSKVTASLGVALSEIEGLRELVTVLTDAKKVADDLAASTVVLTDAAASETAEASLHKIDKHTEAIEKNTKKTEATVRKLKDKA